MFSTATHLTAQIWRFRIRCHRDTRTDANEFKWISFVLSQSLYSSAQAPPLSLCNLRRSLDTHQARRKEASAQATTEHGKAGDWLPSDRLLICMWFLHQVPLHQAVLSAFRPSPPDRQTDRQTDRQQTNSCLNSVSPSVRRSVRPSCRGERKWGYVILKPHF